MTLKQVVASLFSPEELNRIKDNHDGDDGDLRIFYYNGGWIVVHPGLARGQILGKGPTLDDASRNFLENYRDPRRRIRGDYENRLPKTAREIGSYNCYTGNWTMQRYVEIRGTGEDVFLGLLQTELNARIR